MERPDREKNIDPKGVHEHPLPNEIEDNGREQVKLAHEQAEIDIESDLEISASSPNDDLDEGEIARLGDDGAGFI